MQYYYCLFVGPVKYIAKTDELSEVQNRGI